jgi:hypothetical protein
VVMIEYKISRLPKSGIEYAEITPSSYVAEWIDHSTGLDYDFILRILGDTLSISHPIGRPSPDNRNEIVHVIKNILYSSFHNLTILQQDDGDLMVHLLLTPTEDTCLATILLEISHYKEEIRRSYVWERLCSDDVSQRPMKVNCDWCGKNTDRFHVFQSLEVCQNCYVNFPKCSSCYSVIGHSLSQAARINNKRYCAACYAKKQKCNYCNEPLNILYFLDSRDGKPLCFKCRTHQHVHESTVSKALPIVLNIIHDLYGLRTEAFHNFEICDSAKLQQQYRLTKDHGSYLSHKVLGLFDGRNIFLSANLSLQSYIEVISHEYFHYLQRKYLPGWVELGVIEGFAVWGETLVQRFLDDKEGQNRKEGFVLTETVYNKGLNLFKLLEKNYGILGVWDWMQLVKPYPLQRLLELEQIKENEQENGESGLDMDKPAPKHYR